jgi:hypothetical protein
MAEHSTMLDLIMELLAILLIAFVCCSPFLTGWAKKTMRRARHRRAAFPRV